MTATNTGPPLTRFGRRQTKGVILGYSAPVCLSVALAVIVFVGGMFTAQIAGLLITSPVWGTLVAVGFVRWHGAPIIESVPMLAHWQLRTSTGQTQFRAQAAEPRPAGTMGLPGDAAAMRFHEDPDTGVVMVHDPHANTLAAVVRVSYPAFVLLDGDEQGRRVNGWSRVLAGLAATGTTSAIQVLESVIPDPGHGVIGWWKEHGIHDDSWASREYQALMDTAAPSASSHRTLLTLVLDMGKAKSAIKENGRGIPGAASVLAGDMDNLARSLTNAQLRVDGWLTGTELAAVIRQAYDPALDLEDGQPGASMSLGPAAVDEHWDYLRHDSGFTSVLWISDWPTSDTLPSFMHSLVFTSGIRKSVSLIARPLGNQQAMRAIRKEKTDYITDRQQKAKTGRIIDASDDQEYADILAREQALVSGHADMRYVGFVAVTAPTLQQLRSDVSQVERAATNSGLETRLLFGRQAQGFIVAALPLGRTV